jgi:hypothetical protein
MIHIFFPSLVTEERLKGRGPYLSDGERAAFYEKGLRPAIESLAPWDVSDWPTTFADELFRAKKRTGAMAYQTKMVMASVVPRLVGQIRQELADNDVEWGRDCFVLHTIRGTKAASHHSKTVDAAQQALEEYFESVFIDLETIRSEGEWWIDVGLEMSSEKGYCLQWATTSHFHIIRDILQISDEHASRITKLGSSKYNRDIVSHIPAVSGCRIEPGAQAAGQYDAAYCQLYTTDKALTYHPERGHHGKAITIHEAMGSAQPPPFIDSLYQLFARARKANSSKARIEMRVPLRYATTAFLQVSPAVFLNSLVAFTRHEWWYVVLLATLRSTTDFFSLFQGISIISPLCLEWYPHKTSAGSA